MEFFGTAEGPLCVNHASAGGIKWRLRMIKKQKEAEEPCPDVKNGYKTSGFVPTHAHWLSPPIRHVYNLWVVPSAAPFPTTHDTAMFRLYLFILYTYTQSWLSVYP